MESAVLLLCPQWVGIMCNYVVCYTQPPTHSVFKKYNKSQSIYCHLSDKVQDLNAFIFFFLTCSNMGICLAERASGESMERGRGAGTAKL